MLNRLCLAIPLIGAINQDSPASFTKLAAWIIVEPCAPIANNLIN
jgi:hypothetical protein